MDKMTKEQRSRCMASIHSKGTKPELVVRKYLFAHGFRYRLNHPRLPGHPDIVMRKYRTVIFVNGCFWHGHEGCKFLCCRRVERSLASEDRSQQGKGLGGTTEVGGNGLALHHGVGVSTETESKGKDLAVA